MYIDVDFLKTNVIMFIYLQKGHHIFGNIDFWFNGRCIDDVEVLFSISGTTQWTLIGEKIWGVFVKKGMKGKWFEDNIKWRIGKGNIILFWEGAWLGETPLNELYFRIYVNSNQKGLLLGQRGEWHEQEWVEIKLEKRVICLRDFTAGKVYKPHSHNLVLCILYFFLYNGWNIPKMLSFNNFLLLI